MKKIVFATILILILATSFIKNATKEIEDRIFTVSENIRPLKLELGDVLLEYNYLSSPEKLTCLSLYIKNQFSHQKKRLKKTHLLDLLN